MKIVLTEKDKKLMETTSDKDGHFQMAISGLKENATLTFKVLDLDGTLITVKDVVVPDTTPPNRPKVETVYDTSTSVKGTSEPNATIVVKSGTTEIGKGTADGAGKYSITIAKQKAGTDLFVTARDQAGNTGEATVVKVADKTPPAKPVVNAVSDQSTTVTGTTEANATVVVKSGTTEIGKGTADSAGKYSIGIAKQKAGTELSVTATDKAGNIGPATVVKVTDKTPPAKPLVNEVSDQSTKATGTTEANATVVVKSGTTEIGKGTADGAGKYSITIAKQKAGTDLSILATDQAGNRGEAAVIKVADKTAPAKPVVDPVSDQSTKVTGTTEANATVVVKSGTTEIGKGTADSAGKYSVTIAKQKAGTDLTVFAKDQAGNQSEPTIVKVVDKTAPNWPSGGKLEISNIKDKSLLLKWPNATDNHNVSYTIYQNGKEIKKSPADQTNLEIKNLVYEKEYKFAVMALDTSGNKSVLLESQQIILKDEVPPSWPKDSKIKLSNKKASSFSIGWTLAEEAEKYNCYLNKELVQTVESTMTCNFTGLIPGSEYHVKVEAIDKYRNESIDGPEMIIKTEGISRLSGPTRYDTAAAISTTGWKQAETVIIARGDSFPDALAGAPLAYKLNAPILLSNKDKLSPATSAEIKRLGAKKVIILGGTGAVTTAVEKELKGLNLTVERISGSTRYETANAIAKRVGNNKQVVLAYGKNFPDALAIASYAAEKGYPILLTDKDEIAETTKKLVKEYGTSKVIVVGGESVISQKVIQSLSIKNTERIGGKNRYETAANIITKLNLKTDKAFIANGTGFADALTGSVLAAKHQAPLLLAKKTELPTETKATIQKHNIKNFTILGGNAAIGEGVIK